MNEAFKYIFLSLILTFLISNCAISQINNDDEYYNLLNAQIDLLTNNKKDTIYIEKQMINSQLKELINNKKLISRTNSEELKQLFNNNKEIDYLISQLKDTFLINFKKIKSNKVKEYIDPFKRLDSSGNVITDYYYIKIHGSRKYTFSKPIFSIEKKFGIFILVRHNNSVIVKIYKNNNGEWQFFRNIGLAII